jgi:competence protein ComGB
LNGGYIWMKRHKWTIQEQTTFLKMMGELLNRGYPLTEALDSIAFHFPKNRKVEIEEGIYDLKEGYSFYSILQKMNFHDHLIGYVFFAEQHGGLATAFLEGSQIIQKRANDFTKLKKLISYPLFLMLITFILFAFVQKYLLPRFTTLFSSMNLEANFFTNIIYSVGNVLPILFFILLLLIIFLTYYYFRYFRNLQPIEQKVKLMKIPIAAGFLRLFYTHYFSIQLSHLLTGGLSMNESLSMFERNEEQPFYKQLGSEIKLMLRTGEKLEDIFNLFPFFEKDLAMIIKHGQENGKLAEELLFFADRCLRDLEERMDKWMKKIQPVLYMLIGLLIISMYLAVLLPMFHLLDGI